MSESNQPQDMPRYLCHKEVSALRIRSVAGTFLQVEEPFGRIDVGADFIGRHNPQAGGYYVVYEDGYKSYSPQEAFEAGYAPIVDREVVQVDGFDVAVLKTADGETLLGKVLIDHSEEIPHMLVHESNHFAFAEIDQDTGELVYRNALVGTVNRVLELPSEEASQ